MQAEWHRLYSAHAALPSHWIRVETTRAWLGDRLSAAQAPYVSFSGGKDSLAVLALVMDLDRSIPVLTQGDDLDWPGKRAYCERIVMRLGVRDYSYQISQVSAIAQLDAPAIRGTFSHVIAAYVHDRRRRTAILGLRSDESRGRRVARAVRGRDYTPRDGVRRLLPIADWSGRDVLAYLVSADLPLFDLYTWADPLPPHLRRMSWPIVPGLMAHGEAAFTRRHAPGLWNTLIARVPLLATEV